MTDTRHNELRQRIDELDRTIDLLESRRDSLESQRQEIVSAGRGSDESDGGQDGQNDRDENRTPKAKIEELAKQFDDGAPIELVVSELAREGPYGEDELKKEIEQLERRGEVYRPRLDYLRCL